MKKIMMLLIVALLMFGVSGQAMAAFSDGDLIRVVFSTAGTSEMATDLGNITSYTSPNSNPVIFNANNFDFSSLGAGANASNSYVAYFALTISPQHAWISGNAGGQNGSKGVFSSYTTNVHALETAYAAAAGAGSQTTLLMSDPNSFWHRMTSDGATYGLMGGYVPGNTAAISLADLGTTGYVEQVLYYYATAGGLPGIAIGTNVSDLKTYADGHSALNGPTTPIPAAVYLFGSGLMGLVGLRRKMAA